MDTGSIKDDASTPSPAKSSHKLPDSPEEHKTEKSTKKAYQLELAVYIYSLMKQKFRDRFSSTQMMKAQAADLTCRRYITTEIRIFTRKGRPWSHL